MEDLPAARGEEVQILERLHSRFNESQRARESWNPIYETLSNLCTPFNWDGSPNSMFTGEGEDNPERNALEQLDSTASVGIVQLANKVQQWIADWQSGVFAFNPTKKGMVDKLAEELDDKFEQRLAEERSTGREEEHNKEVWHSWMRELKLERDKFVQALRKSGFDEALSFAIREMVALGTGVVAVSGGEATPLRISAVRLRDIHFYSDALSGFSDSFRCYDMTWQQAKEIWGDAISPPKAMPHEEIDPKTGAVRKTSFVEAFCKKARLRHRQRRVASFHLYAEGKRRQRRDHQQCQPTRSCEAQPLHKILLDARCQFPLWLSPASNPGCRYLFDE